MFDYGADVYECPICGTKHSGEMAIDPCPHCSWIISGGEDEDENEYDEVNYCSIREAKERYKKGLNIFGKPLPNEKPNN